MVHKVMYWIGVAAVAAGGETGMGGGLFVGLAGIAGLGERVCAVPAGLPAITGGG